MCSAEHRLSRAPPDFPRPRGSATATPHRGARCPRRKKGRHRSTRRAGTIERRPPGDGLLDLRDPREGRGFQHLRSWFPPGDCFFIQYFGFFEDETVLPLEGSLSSFLVRDKSARQCRPRTVVRVPCFAFFCFVYIYLFCFVFISSLLCMVLFFFVDLFLLFSWSLCCGA